MVDGVSTQIGLFAPIVHTRGKGTIAERFAAFDRANPMVYTLLAREARALIAAGHTKIGIGMLWERLRWLYAMDTTGDEFRLNNNFRSHYARLLMEREPDLAGVFETRELRSA
jgi:hypothetical protein